MHTHKPPKATNQFWKIMGKDNNEVMGTLCTRWVNDGWQFLSKEFTGEATLHSVSWPLGTCYLYSYSLPVIIRQRQYNKYKLLRTYCIHCNKLILLQLSCLFILSLWAWGFPDLDRSQAYDHFPSPVIHGNHWLLHKSPPSTWVYQCLMNYLAAMYCFELT